MAKPTRARPLPSTPKPGASGSPGAPDGQVPADVAGGPVGPGSRGDRDDPAAPVRGPRTGATSAAGATGARSARDAASEPDHLVRGTHCLAGHERGQALGSARFGPLPTRRAARIGFALAVWCTIGLALVLDARWIGVLLQLLVIWLVFCALVQWRAGHRRRCWGTRTWRYAWGRLAPGTPPRPA